MLAFKGVQSEAFHFNNVLEPNVLFLNEFSSLSGLFKSNELLFVVDRDECLAISTFYCFDLSLRLFE